MTIDQAREKVARGAALLDRERPGWAQEIDAGRLDMGDPCECVLGQLEQSFFVGIVRYMGRGWYPAALRHGFERDCPDLFLPSDEIARESDRLYRLLQDAWIDAIAARLVPVEQPALVTA